MFPVFSTRWHGVIDYILALFLITFSISNYETGSVHPWLLFLAAGLILVGTFTTKFECGYAGIFSIPTHLTADIIGGILLAACPLFFEYGGQWHLVEYAGGIAWFGMGVCTRPYIVSNHKPVLSPDREGNPPE